MTKDDERKALAKLEKFIASLDEDSYVATALKGVVNDARDNIENDWAMSRYDAWQDAEQRADRTEAMLVETADKLAAEVKAFDELRESYIKIVEKKNKQIYDLTNDFIAERKELHLELPENKMECTPFHSVELLKGDGQPFIRITEKSGWVTCYKMDDIDGFVIA